jgi:hypothetical protein
MVALFYHIALTEGGDFAAWHAPGAFAEESAAVAVFILWGVVGEFAAIVTHWCSLVYEGDVAGHLNSVNELDGFSLVEVRYNVNVQPFSFVNGASWIRA